MLDALRDLLVWTVLTASTIGPGTVTMCSKAGARADQTPGPATSRNPGAGLSELPPPDQPPADGAKREGENQAGLSRPKHESAELGAWRA